MNDMQVKLLHLTVRKSSGKLQIKAFIKKTKLGIWKQIEIKICRHIKNHLKCLSNFVNSSFCKLSFTAIFSFFSLLKNNCIFNFLQVSLIDTPRADCIKQTFKATAKSCQRRFEERPLLRLLHVQLNRVLNKIFAQHCNATTPEVSN